MTTTSAKIIACATVIEEMLPLLPEDTPYEVLDFGLHLTPDTLRAALQRAIDAASAEVETIILGYGLCSLAVVGLQATNCTLVVPRVDDCIAIFLGSHAAYRMQASQEPGTYYLTKGWLEVGDTPFAEYDRLADRYGPERARRMIKLMLKHYTRLAFIDTGRHDQERYRAYTRAMAQQFDLRYEELPGSTALVEKMVRGPWNGDFVVARPGTTITYADFKTSESECSLNHERFGHPPRVDIRGDA